MLSYVEIKPGDMENGSWGFNDISLMHEIRNKWHFNETEELGTKFYRNDQHRFLLSVVRGRQHVYPALKHMLFERSK
jgi:hypothetical protein